MLAEDNFLEWQSKGTALIRTMPYHRQEQDNLAKQLHKRFITEASGIHVG
jgi:antibiotic biosynthesis monooxygenase (ABM) superfamily enzyme